jgi:hypothetical protein
MANVYALSLGVTQVSPREEAAGEPSWGHPGDPLSDSQGDKTESQGDTQVSHPSVFPSVIPSSFPKSEDRVAHAREATGMVMNGKDLEKRRRPPRDHCATCGVFAEDHDRFVKDHSDRCAGFVSSRLVATTTGVEQ